MLNGCINTGKAKYATIIAKSWFLCRCHDGTRFNIPANAEWWYPHEQRFHPIEWSPVHHSLLISYRYLIKPQSPWRRSPPESSALTVLHHPVSPLIQVEGVAPASLRPLPSKDGTALDNCVVKWMILRIENLEQLDQLGQLGQLWGITSFRSKRRPWS